MTIPWRSIGRALLIVFLLWHMAAVAIYALPVYSKHPFVTKVRGGLPGLLIAPYTLMLSQWQQWDLFSPDPFRRVTRYEIDARIDNEWTRVGVIDPDYYPWWQQAMRSKFLINALEADQGTYHLHIAQHILRMFCKDFNVPPHTEIRFTRISYVIPHEAPDGWAEFPRHLVPNGEVISECLPPR